MRKMIQISKKSDCLFRFLLVTKEQAGILPDEVNSRFDGEFLSVYTVDAGKNRREYYIGAGEEIDFLQAVRLGAKCSRLAKTLRLKEDEAVMLDAENVTDVLGDEKVSGFIRGLWLGAYEPEDFKKADEKKDEKEKFPSFSLFLNGKSGGQKEDFAKMLSEQENLAKAIYFVRDMTNKPSNMLWPKDLADQVAGLAKSAGVEAEVFDYDKIKELGMGGLLAVGESSGHLPRFVILRYRGADSSAPVIGLVGKGVTVDTGGYCIKPGSSMPGMRGDMAGAAAVAATVFAIAANKEKVNVTAVMPMCENRISRESFLPGDVLTMYNGHTVEVLNTDAEGRLILADAVAYAVKNEKVEAVVDIATLTGAVVSMYGFTIAGVLSDNDDLYDLLRSTEGHTEERYARIPYFKEHEDMIKSDYADVKNLGPNYCGTITAGLFIRHFAGKKPWMHFDIAGTAWMDTPLWEHQSKGATGAGVTGLYELCRSWAKNPVRTEE